MCQMDINMATKQTVTKQSDAEESFCHVKNASLKFPLEYQDCYTDGFFSSFHAGQAAKKKMNK